MSPSKEIFSKISRLEAVERRWLWSVLASIILSSILVALSLSHLDIAGIARTEPVRIPPTQFLIQTIALIVILVSNLLVLIEYFAFELRVERAVVIKKRKRQEFEREDEGE